MAPALAAPLQTYGELNVKRSTREQGSEEAEEGATSGRARRAAGEPGQPIGRHGGPAEKEVMRDQARCCAEREFAMGEAVPVLSPACMRARQSLRKGPARVVHRAPCSPPNREETGWRSSLSR